ncbi:MAG TPA: hypothetical protein VF123_16935 [Candidatus Sulfotelmatobacter sp.]
MLASLTIYRSSDASGLLVWSLIGFCAGSVLFFYGFRLLQRRRLILDTPFSKIRSASLGMAEISGLATGPYTMLAPITGRPCYYFRTLAWEWKQHGKNKEWVKIAGECMHLPFFLDDNTGRMLIDPRGADLDLHRDFQQEFCDSFFTTKDPAPESVRNFLARHGVMTDNKIKVEEFCIKPKNALFALGTVAENTALDVTPQPIRESAEISSLSIGKFSLSLTPTGFNSIGGDDHIPVLTEPVAIRVDALHEVVRLPSHSAPMQSSEMTQQQKIAAALVKAGISSPAAWSVAGVPSESASGVQVVSDPASTSSRDGGGSNGFDPHPPVVLRKGENDKTFLISWRSQQEVARALAWKCTLMIWGGPVLALLSLYVLLSMTRVIH